MALLTVRGHILDQISAAIASGGLTPVRQGVNSHQDTILALDGNTSRFTVDYHFGGDGRATFKLGGPAVEELRTGNGDHAVPHVPGGKGAFRNGWKWRTGKLHVEPIALTSDAEAFGGLLDLIRLAAGGSDASTEYTVLAVYAHPDLGERYAATVRADSPDAAEALTECRAANDDDTIELHIAAVVDPCGQVVA